MIKITRRAIAWLVTVSLAATLAACGGGTANGQCKELDPSRKASLPNCKASPASTAPVKAAAVAAIKLSLADASDKSGKIYPVTA